MTAFIPILYHTIINGIIVTRHVGAGIITFTKLAATIFGAQVQSYTNTGDGGGTGYYINLGGIKLCWGRTGSMSIAGASTKNISMPPSFFSTVASASIGIHGSAVYPSQLASAPTNTTLAVYFASGSGTAQVNWFAIGS